jgi:hypothetical protein
MALKRLYLYLQSLKPFAEGIHWRLDADAIVVGGEKGLIGVVSEEKGVLELSFDRSCPYTHKIALIKLLRKAAPDETLVIGPDITMVPLSLAISSDRQEGVE